MNNQDKQYLNYDNIQNILKIVKEKITISNLEGEYKMKINQKRKIIGLVAAIILLFTGSLFTVDAASNGEITKTIKEKVKSMVEEQINKEVEVEVVNVQKDENGMEIVTYKLKDGGMLVLKGQD